MDAYIATHSVCHRRMLDIRNVQLFLEANDHNIVDNSAEADIVLFYGCGFNQTREDESWKKIHKIHTKIIPMSCLYRLKCESIPTDADAEVLNEIFARGVFFEEIEDDGIPYGESETINYRAIQTGWGCADNCTYCGDKKAVGNIRSVSLRYIVKQIRHYAGMNLDYIELLGDDVGAWGQETGVVDIRDLLEAVFTNLWAYTEIRIREMNIKWMVHYNLGEWLQNEELGFLTLGFQSGSTRLLDKMNRGYSHENLVKLFNELMLYEKKAHFHILEGFPSETDLDISNTINLVKPKLFTSGSVFFYEPKEGLPQDVPLKLERIKHRNMYRNSFFNMGYSCEYLDDKMIFRLEK